MASEMVKGFWKKAFAAKLFKLDYDKAYSFVKSQWQHTDGISVPYLLYRMMVAVFFLAAFLASLLGAGRIQKNGILPGWRWPIFLTNWGLTLCTLQAVFAVVIVTVAKMRESHQMSVSADNYNATLPLHYKIYWAIHTTATTIAVSITVAFWAAIYNPEEHPLDAVNILSHAMNGIMMTLDLIIVAHPIRIAHMYLPLCFTVVYMVFNGLYYLTGGTDKFGRTYLYTPLKWEKTGYAFLACLLGLIFVAVVHTVLSLLSAACRHLAKLHRTPKSEEKNLPF